MIIIAGADKGKKGEVVRVAGDKVVVQNVNIIKRHTKPNPQANVAGGIIEREAPIHVSNVAIWNPVTQKPDRVGIRLLEDGRKVRFYKGNGEQIGV